MPYSDLQNETVSLITNPQTRLSDLHISLLLQRFLAYTYIANDLDTVTTLLRRRL